MQKNPNVIYTAPIEHFLKLNFEIVYLCNHSLKEKKCLLNQTLFFKGLTRKKVGRVLLVK